VGDGLIGIFIILVGVGLIYAPLAIWPYPIAGFLVLPGVRFIVRGMSRGITGLTTIFKTRDLRKKPSPCPGSRGLLIVIPRIPLMAGILSKSFGRRYPEWDRCPVYPGER
jgi:hypothetical protein